MFADDTTIYFIGKGVEEIIDALNLILNNLKVKKVFVRKRILKGSVIIEPLVFSFHK